MHSKHLPLAFVLALTLGAHADGLGTKRDAELLKRKVATINAFGERQPQKARRTVVSEKEVNAYLSFDAGEQLPVGVVEPSIAILGTGRLSGRAVVDLDAVRRSKNPTSLLDPTFYLTGRLPVTAVGVLRTSEGKGAFDLQSATVGGLPIPKRMLQEIVSHYSRTPARPGGLDLDDPFPLPSGIREILVEHGQAIIVQ